MPLHSSGTAHASGLGVNGSAVSFSTQAKEATASAAAPPRLTAIRRTASLYYRVAASARVRLNGANHTAAAPANPLVGAVAMDGHCIYDPDSRSPR